MARFYKVPSLLPKVFPTFWWRLPQEKPTIFLTFDDGPIPQLTPFILEMLQKYQAQATFFCVGDNIRKYSFIFEQIIINQHQVANHTFHHLNAWKTPSWQYLQDIQLCQGLIKPQATSLLFRPPYGKLTPQLIRAIQKNMKIVYWDVLTYDFDPQLAPEKCLQNAIRYTQNGSIIVFHDNVKAYRNLTYVLPRYIEHFATKGFTFKALPAY